MSRRCINPSCFQGDPGDPPEYVSDRGRECDGCGLIIDLDDDDDYVETATGYLCAECKPEEDEEDESL